MPRTFGLDKRDPATGLFRKACTCGHDHLTDRGEPVSLCLECSCMDQALRCQNCGEEGNGTRVGDYEVCSRRCALQVEHLLSLKGKAAA